jgi:uncharacterized protein (DUF1800 family)
MSDMETRPVSLKPAMVQYLDEVTKAYQLEDAGKAIRCLVNYARENPDKRDEIFSEMRCLDC